MQNVRHHFDHIEVDAKIDWVIAQITFSDEFIGMECLVVVLKVFDNLNQW